MQIDTRDMISVTDAGKLGISRLVTDASEGRPRVLLKNNRAVAVIVGDHQMERLQHLDDIADDLRLWGIALARTVTDSGERHTLEDVAAELGIDLDDDPDDAED